MSDYPAGEPGVIDLGLRHFALIVSNGRMVMWWHDCPAVEHRSWHWIGEDAAGTRSGHRIVSIYPPHVEGSLVCVLCRDHGFIHNGSWRAA